MTDRELDALVAEHLFNLDVAERDCVVVHETRGPYNSRTTCIYGVDSMPWAVSMTSGKKPIRLWVVPGGPGDYQEVDHYSTTGNGMLAVIEAMIPKVQLKFGMDYSLSLKGDPWWGASFGKRFGTDRTSAPRAVAIAALRALGVEVPE